MSSKVDLYLGGDLGIWVLQQVEVAQINQVVTLDNSIAELAHRLKLPAWVGNANELEFAAGVTGFSVHYPRILRKPLIGRYAKIYNLHPGYLPWGRGYYPVFWALWEETIAGATLHEMTVGVDEGPIVAQLQVLYDESDTGASLWQRVRIAEQQLFQTYWTAISSGHYPEAIAQPSGGSYHTRRELLQLKQSADWRKLSSYDLLKLIRCFSFPGYSGLEVCSGGKTFELYLKPVIGTVIETITNENSN